MEVAAAVIGSMWLKQLFNDGWVVKEKGHLVHSSGAEMIQPQPLDDRPMLARRANGEEQECDGVREAIRFIR